MDSPVICPGCILPLALTTRTGWSTTASLKWISRWMDGRTDWWIARPVVNGWKADGWTDIFYSFPSLLSLFIFLSFLSFLYSCFFSSFSKFHHSSFFIFLLLSFLSTSPFHFFSVLLFLSWLICSVIFHYFFPVFFPLVPSFYFNTCVSILSSIFQCLSFSISFPAASTLVSSMWTPFTTNMKATHNKMSVHSHLQASWLARHSGSIPLIGDDVAKFVHLTCWILLPQFVLIDCCGGCCLFLDSLWCRRLVVGGWSLLGRHFIGHWALCDLIDEDKWTHLIGNKGIFSLLYLFIYEIYKPINLTWNYCFRLIFLQMQSTFWPPKQEEISSDVTPETLKHWQAKYTRLCFCCILHSYDWYVVFLLLFFCNKQINHHIVFGGKQCVYLLSCSSIVPIFIWRINKNKTCWRDFFFFNPLNANGGQVCLSDWIFTLLEVQISNVSFKDQHIK